MAKARMTARLSRVAWRAEARRRSGLWRRVRDRKMGMAPSGSWMTRIVVKAVRNTAGLRTSSSTEGLSGVRGRGGAGAGAAGVRG
ncbi:hypothetical protein ADENT20671_1182 [Actinomyces denticolens]|nr:hypothetical protein ADENT20671_1182 [Actinomyces denticolens]